MNFRPRDELETQFGVIDGSYEELIAQRGKFPDGVLYEILPSRLNTVRVSRVTYVTYQEYAPMNKLAKSGVSIHDMARRHHMGVKSVGKIARDEFNILHSGQG